MSDEVIEVKRSDLLSFIFEDRFPFPQIRLMLFHGEIKVGVCMKDGGMRIMPKDMGWLTFEEVERELLKRYR